MKIRLYTNAYNYIVCIEQSIGYREFILYNVRVYNPHAPSNRLTTPSACYRRHENEKRRRMYNQRVRDVEQDTFAPLVFSASGGMRPTAVVFYKQLARMIAERSNQQYSTTMGLIRCQISIPLLRSAIMCLRGSRSSYHRPTRPLELPPNVVVNEGWVACLLVTNDYNLP